MGSGSGSAGAAAEGLKPIERYEYKYLVAPELVEPITRAVRPWCEPDAHMRAAGGVGYTIRSLYLDSPGMVCYWAKRDRHLDRFKLRVRSYQADGSGPFFVEIKRKIGDRVFKHRGRCRADQLLGVVGQGPMPASLDHDEGLRRFHVLAGGLSAKPVVLVRYQRAAYTGVLDPYARVTFDTRMQAQPPADYDLAGLPDRWYGVDPPQGALARRSLVVLELKFGAAVPCWMAALVRRFQLTRVGFSKFCNGLDVTLGGSTPGRERRRDAGIVDPRAAALLAEEPRWSRPRAGGGGTR